MQIEAIYDRGQLTFTRPIKLRRDQVRLVVEVPDEELASPAPVAEPPSISKTRDRLNAILGRWREGQDSASGCAEYKAVWRAHLEDKYHAGR
jgi:hypothetical protein